MRDKVFTFLQKAISIIQIPHRVAKVPCHMLNFKVGSVALTVVLMELGRIDGQGWLFSLTLACLVGLRKVHIRERVLRIDTGDMVCYVLVKTMTLFYNN